MFVVLLALAGIRPAYSQTKDFDVPAQSATTGIPEFARQAGIQILVSEPLVRGKRVAAVTGSYLVGQALAILLTGTGLTATTKDSVTYTIATTAPPATSSGTIHFNVPTQSLDEALKDFGVQSGLTVVAPTTLTGGKKAAAVRGDLAPTDALERLLKGSGLTFARAADGTIAIQAIASNGALQASAGESGAEKGLTKRAELEEIIVTAAKRPQLLRDVPIAVQVETAEDLYKLGAKNFSDYAQTLAGVQVMEVGTGRNQIFIRGVAAPQGYIGMESAIGVYLDDVPISEGMNQPDFNLFDIDRVEVLRGPQGTLYGSASLGGTIRIITNQPKLDVFEGLVDTEFSETEHGGFNPSYSVMLNVPIVSELVAVRAVLYGRNPSGFIDNPTLNETRVNAEDTYGGRFDVRIAPSNQLSFDLKVVEQHTRQGAYDQADSVNGSYVDLDQYRRIPEPFEDSDQIYNETVVYGAAAFTVDSSTSYSRRRRDIYDDFTGLDFLGDNALTPSYQRYLAEVLTQEVRVSSVVVKPISWLIGGYFNRTNNNFFQTIDSAGAGALFGLPSDNIGQLAQTVTDKQKALFGEVGYSPIERLTLTAGIRVADLSLNATSLRSGLIIGGVLENANDTTQHASAPKFNISAKITPDAVAYVQAAKGYRIGGVNVTIEPVNGFVFPTTYAPDSLWNYEVGFKGSALDRRLSFDTDVFYIDWRNIQVNLLNSGFDYFANAGNAVSKGAEAQGALRLTDHVQFGSQLTYTDARLTTTTSGVGNSGDRVPFVPQFAGSAFAEYDWSIDGGQAYLRLDVQHVGTAFTGFGEVGNYSYGGYTLTNSRLGLDRKSWRFALFAKNLFDKGAALFAQPYYAGVITSQNAEGITVVRPRTIGIEASWRF
jgi:iron complex outermembrane recepter protein